MLKVSLKLGTVVMLKSGGPKMTVKHHNLGFNVIVNWFSKDGLLQVAPIDPQMLKVIKKAV